ncbi:preprotein translocase subunit SecG [Hymenobacter norwichensis]|uniref:preprotein translocase subunit SecG n=1 Tax=Hymenobacter norwichensis TaxID=223903 RepID=UPI0003B746A7|nr:preprotein translocase subunit SecG [Hymenobacter norwichensis]
MYAALIVVILIVCFLLAIVVLAQNPKGGGLSSQFGSGGAANLMGVKRTGDLLERMTWGFAIGLMVLTLGTHVISGTQAGNGPVRSVNQRRALEQQKVPSVPAPTAPGATAPAAGGATPPAQQPASPAPASTPAQ